MLEGLGVRQELTYLPIGDFGLDCDIVLGQGRRSFQMVDQPNLQPGPVREFKASVRSMVPSMFRG